MDIVNGRHSYETIRVKEEGEILYIQIYRPSAQNAINDRMIEEMSQALDRFQDSAKIIVLEGLPEVFCFGADFQSIKRDLVSGNQNAPQDPAPLYDLWLKLATGPFISIAHVRGKANAGGIGFVAACDLVLSDDKAVFSLSEMLFGLMPACVLPFLIRRMGVAKSNYMTLTTQPVPAPQARDWGLVDSIESDSENLLRKQLLRLRRLSKQSIVRYKAYIKSLDDSLSSSRSKALKANVEVFSDQQILQSIAHYVKTGEFPWEGR